MQCSGCFGRLPPMPPLIIIFIYIFFALSFWTPSCGFAPDIWVQLMSYLVFCEIKSEQYFQWSSFGSNMRNMLFFFKYLIIRIIISIMVHFQMPSLHKALRKLKGERQCENLLNTLKIGCITCMYRLYFIYKTIMTKLKKKKILEALLFSAVRRKEICFVRRRAFEL